MLFKIDPRIFIQNPGAVVAVVVAYNLKKTKDTKELESLFKNEQHRIKEKFANYDWQKDAIFADWKQAYRNFGADSQQYLCSIENLIRRLVKNGRLKSINTLVDLYNIISLRYLLPVGGEDLNHIAGDLVLTVASNNEKPAQMLGDVQPHIPWPGEVIYKDEEGIVCRCWNWREADRTKLTEQTHNAIFVIEIVSPEKKSQLEKAARDLADLLKKYTDADKIEIHLVDQKKSSVSFDNPTSLVTKTIDVTVAADPVRLEKVKAMRQAGLDPWPAPEHVTAHAKQIIDEFKEDSEKTYNIAGRLLSIRAHGKTVFAHLQDDTGKLQIYVKQDQIGEQKFSQWHRFIDIGDIIWCSGTAFKTKMGEITLNVADYQLQSKCLYPLPDKFHGLTDIEHRYRQRYLDLISNEESKQRFKMRFSIIRAMRHFLDNKGYLEVETPMLHPIPGGAAARPFKTHHNALDMELYLRIAPELYLKRLIVGGFERVYEINRNFRNEGISTRHNPEFTMLEFYTAFQDFSYALAIVEELIRAVCQSVCGTKQIAYGSTTLDFEKPFERLSMHAAIARYAQCTETDLDEKNIDKVFKAHSLTAKPGIVSWGQKLCFLFEELVEKQLVQPTYITEFPIEVSPLSKRNKDNPALADRFELFIMGMELSNAFAELNDPFEQAARFQEQVKARKAGDVEAHYYDADFIKSLEYGMPPTVGVGIGIDRLAMLLTNAHSIRDVILFPTLRIKE